MPYIKEQKLDPAGFGVFYEALRGRVSFASQRVRDFVG